MRILVLMIFIFTVIIIKFTKKEHYIDSISNFQKSKNWNKLGFSDKLKLYGDSLNEKHTFFSDKYNVKSYITKLNIKDLHIANTINTLNINKSTSFNDLPSNCIIKTNNGSGDIIKIKNSKITLIKGRGRKYKNNIENLNLWKKYSIKPQITEHEKHYQHMIPIIFIEEYLGDNIKDYKFYCIKGKVILYHIDSDRYIKACRNIYDRNSKLLPFEKGDLNCKYEVKQPKNLKKMIEISEKISSIFEFARIDLYEINDKIYFGEITFLPAGGKNTFNPKKYDRIIGKLWK